jgi:rare lipoprotein A (peptidoglycan hydrolase)
MHYRIFRDILFALALTFLVFVIFTTKPARAQIDCFPNCFSSETSQQKLVKVKQQKLAKKKRIRTVARTRNVDSSGLASYYWQPQRVASGGWFNPNALTAAHRTLPFGTRVRVTNVRNNKSVIVTINDRGPFIRGRIIDLSLAAAKVIAMTKSGVVPVKIERV